MGLSEREQQLLDEMERRLYQSEADVMQTPSGPRPQLNLRFLVWGTVLGLVGVGLLIAGVSAQLLVLGILGFDCMLGGVLLATSKRDGAAEVNPTSSRAAHTVAAAPKESFSDRMNRRWEERMDGDR